MFGIIVENVYYSVFSFNFSDFYSYYIVGITTFITSKVTLFTRYRLKHPTSSTTAMAIAIIKNAEK